MIRLFGRRRPEPAPLLSDAEMKRLHEEIFEDPVSVDILLHMLYAVPAEVRARSEWVMDAKMRNRIRRLGQPAGPYFSVSFNLTEPETLFGLPVVVESLAKLELRERAS